MSMTRRHLANASTYLKQGVFWRSAWYFLRIRSWRRRVARWRTNQQDPDGGVVMRVHRVKMLLPYDSVLSHLIYTGAFEGPETAFLSRVLMPGDTFVDVGANIGLFTLVAARRVGQSGRVISVEPVGRTFARLEKNVALNGFRNVTCCNVALSDEEGTAVIHVPGDGHDAWSSLAGPGDASSAVAERVRTTRLDTLLDDRGAGTGVAVVKVDAEGWETHVFAGGSGLFARDDAPVVLVEFTQENLTRAGSSCAQLYRQIVAFGYKLYRLTRGGRRLVEEELRGEYPYDNLIAAKPASSSGRRLRVLGIG